MRILVTGATGFVGTWLSRDLRAAGHDPVGTPPSTELEITDPVAVRRFVGDVRPDAVAHLAAISFGPDARADPSRAMAVNEGGTRHVLEAVAAERPGIPVLVTSSAEVYGSPGANDLPLAESAPLRADHPYGLSKIAQERTALERGRDGRATVIISRAFNHTGPGQRPDFVAPALARRVLEARALGRTAIRVGSVDVQRDFLDVRDVVRAYRLLLEGAAAGRLDGGTVVNVASGEAVSIRRLIELIGAEVGLAATPAVDPELVRPNDPPTIVGDAGRLRALTGWTREVTLEQSIADLMGSLTASADPELDSPWAAGQAV